MPKDTFIKNGKVMNILDYESLGHMVSESDYMVTEEVVRSYRKCPKTSGDCCIPGNCEDCPNFVSSECKGCGCNFKPIETTPAENRNFDGSNVSWMHNDELGQDGSDSYSKRVIRHNNKLNKRIMPAKFSIGDKVKIINYGAMCWISSEFAFSSKGLKTLKEEGDYIICDTYPELVGKEGIISEVTKTQGEWQYAINGLTKYAWYDEEQLEMISKNNNTL
jgi:hypothetical protein